MTPQDSISENCGLFFGDCLERLKDVPDGMVDLVLADMPYGMTQCKWDQIIPLDVLWPLLHAVTKKSAIFAFTASQPFTSILVLSNIKEFKHEWIWIKNRGSNFANTVREPMKEHESVLIFSKGKWTYNKQMQERTGGGKALIGKRVSRRGGKRDGLGEFNHYGTTEAIPELRVPSSWQKFNTEVGLHPTQKPVDLMRYLIRTYTNPGDVVLDFCMGSGTTGVAAKLEGRNFIGIEQDEKYFTEASARIAGEA